ncbi:fungal hydrophobin-domain-containing protein [Cubamyces lactineus]|nr:fungal hydrophobin-domain-containing protein [Cubamyces lactineus]
MSGHPGSPVSGSGSSPSSGTRPDSGSSDGGDHYDSRCNTGPVQCCNKVMTPEDASSRGLLTGLAGINVHDLSGLVGVDCSPIAPVGLSGNECSAHPVCCENNSVGALVSVGCIPVSL